MVSLTFILRRNKTVYQIKNIKMSVSIRSQTSAEFMVCSNSMTEWWGGNYDIRKTRKSIPDKKGVLSSNRPATTGSQK